MSVGTVAVSVDQSSAMHAILCMPFFAKAYRGNPRRELIQPFKMCTDALETLSFSFVRYGLGCGFFFLCPFILEISRSVLEWYAVCQAETGRVAPILQCMA
eukprot:309014-Amphidinium_carterae.1